MLISLDEPRQVWLLVRTKPKQESALVQALASRDVAAYCPRVLEPRWHARAPHVPVPLFPSYVFAHCVPKEKYTAVRYCTGASSIVRFGEALGAVEDEFIASLREREGERGYLVFADARRAPVKGSRVRIVEGPLQGIEGVVTHYLPAKARVRLLLTMVSGVRNVEVDARHIRCA
ncbi:MAG TPA: transcription termination/antitermination NusG family protein [Thermoanaerobaculaceae bacterium]|nr:transcription termination/antitermination NusG family protein [Thermoanaerobaculaceae bacterium]